MNIDNYNEDVLITSLELVNFMCHDHLVIEFKKPFTCIGGRNGSGKSAIMIALGILFGQRSSSLDRGSSFKNLIKTGQQFFTIKCVLNNTKKYCYDFFGDYIIIEKKVTLKSSAFSITNKQRKVHSSKMEDLEYLLDVFNIKLENPLNYLTQEQSKKFLSSADPTHLYKLFLKGTEIADIQLINEKYESNIASLREKIENIEIHVTEINAQLEAETKRMQILDNIDKLASLIKQDQDELKWTSVYSIKEIIDTLEKEIYNLDIMIEKEQQVNTQLMEETEDFITQKDSVVEYTQTLKTTNKEKMTKIDDKLAKLSKKVRSMENERKDIKESWKIKKDLINRLGKCNTVVDERETLKQRKEEIENKLLETRSQQEQFEVILNKEKKLKEEQDQEISEYKKKVYTLQNQIDYCNKVGENDAVHSEMKRICSIIKNQNFKEEVIGPLCDFVKLKDQKWWKVASIVLQKNLTSFICFNREDRDKLSQIFRNNNVQFSILIPSNKSGNLIRYEKNPKFKVLLDVLDCKNNVVLNQLIIMSNIEEKALIEDRREAYKSIRTDPKNIDCIYTATGDIIKKMNGSVSDFAPRKLDKYYFEKPRDKQKNYQAELNQLMKNKPDMKNSPNFEKAQRDCDICLQLINKLERNLADLNRQIESAEELFSAQQEVMNNDEITESYHNLENQMKLLNNKIDKVNDEIKALNADKEGISNTQYPSISDIETNIYKLRMKTNVSNDNIHKLVQKKVHTNNKLQDKIREFDNARNELLKEIPEIKNPRPRNIILEEISQFELEIEESKKIGNKEDTEDLIKEILEKKRINEEILKLNKNKVEDVYEAYIQRINKREEIKEFISKNASRRFKELTSERNYKGDLEFDHEEKKLHLKMEVHNFGISGTKETLSGGERSFAAMSLLFSLWPYISCPLKVLDEFDVFMDDLNRKYIIQKFIEYFKKSDNQVILITPLNTKDLQDEEVDIQILQPPRENNE